MKRPIFISATIVCFIIISISGCKKQIQQNVEDKKGSSGQTTQSQPWFNSTMPSENIAVSEYGFLIFPDADDFSDYRTFVLRSTHAEVREYLERLGVHSLGATLYGEEYASQPVTEEQSVNYIFNTDKIFQVQNVIIKPIGETNAEVSWQFILTMTPEYLSNASYEKLAAGTFDINTMNQFATNPEDEDLDMFEFITKTPLGYQEIEPNATQARRPMFGRRSKTWRNYGGAHWEGSGDCVVCWEDVKRSTLYLFWIGFPGKEQYTGSDCDTVDDSQCK